MPSFIYHPRSNPTTQNNSSPQNEIAINVISPIPSHAKMVLVPPQSSCAYMSK